MAVQTGANVMIAVLSSMDGAKKVVVRAAGATLDDL